MNDFHFFYHSIFCYKGACEDKKEGGLDDNPKDEGEDFFLEEVFKVLFPQSFDRRRLDSIKPMREEEMIDVE